MRSIKIWTVADLSPSLSANSRDRALPGQITQARCYLTSLPPEVRMMIYGYVRNGEPTLRGAQHSGPSRPENENEPLTQLQFLSMNNRWDFKYGCSDYNSLASAHPTFARDLRTLRLIEPKLSLTLHAMSAYKHALSWQQRVPIPLGFSLEHIHLVLGLRRRFREAIPALMSHLDFGRTMITMKIVFKEDATFPSDCVDFETEWTSLMAFWPAMKCTSEIFFKGVTFQARKMPPRPPLHCIDLLKRRRRLLPSLIVFKLTDLAGVERQRVHSQ